MNSLAQAQSASMGSGAAFVILIGLAFIGGLILSWWALSALKWESFVKNPRTPQVTMLRLLLAIFGGLLVSGVAGLYVLILWMVQQ